MCRLLRDPRLGPDRRNCVGEGAGYRACRVSRSGAPVSPGLRCPVRKIPASSLHQYFQSVSEKQQFPADRLYKTAQQLVSLYGMTMVKKAYIWYHELSQSASPLTSLPSRSIV